MYNRKVKPAPKPGLYIILFLIRFVKLVKMNYYIWRERDAGGMADVVPRCLDNQMLEAYISGSDDPYMKITQHNASKSTQNSCFMWICVSIEVTIHTHIQ